MATKADEFRAIRRREDGMLNRAAISAALVLGLIGTGCQSGPKSVSLEEAKQITASIQTASFAAPPRTITDITAILDQQKRADPVAAEQARAAAEDKPPAGLSQSDLAAFYRNRAKAARNVGRAAQEIADLKKAADLTAGTRGWARSQILWELGSAETFSGNLADSIRHRQESFAGIPDEKKGARIPRTAVLAIVSAFTGNLEAADKALAESENLLSVAQNWRGWARQKVRWTINVDRARASVADARGLYAEAEKFHRAAVSGNAEEIRKNPSDKNRQFIHDLILGNLARNLLRQDRLMEAEIEARKAVLNSLARTGRFSRDSGRTVRELARVIGAQGRYEDAEKLLRATIDIYSRIGAAKESVIVANARLLLAEALVNQEKWQDAVVEYDTVDTALASELAVYGDRAKVKVSRAVALLNVGRVAEALASAQYSLDWHTKAVGNKHFKTAMSRGVLAMILARNGNHEGALDGFRQAIPILLSRSRRSADEETTQAAKTLRLQWILESYLELLGTLPQTAAKTPGFDAAAEAFRIAQVARSGSVQTALAASSARAAARDPDLAELVRREQDAQKQIAALYGLLTEARSVPTTQQDPGAVNDLRTRIDRLRSARGAIASEISDRFPEYWDLIDPRPATIESARSILQPNEALITTYVGSERTFVWAIPAVGPTAFSVAEFGDDALAEAVASVRAALEPNAATLGDIPPFDVAGAHALYQALLEPVKAGWGGAKSLLVVAHGPLGYLPLSLLPTKAVDVAATAPLFSGYRDVPWLVRDHAVTVLPSVASLRTLRALPAGPATRKTFVGFGDPYFNKEQEIEARAEQSTQIAMRGLRLRSSPRTDQVDSAQLAMLPRLPDTADEVRGMAAALGAEPVSSVFLGKAAAETAVKGMDLSAVKVIAFATHGLVPGDLDGLTQPALALTSPLVAGGDDDGLLTMGEILGLRLNADWAVLSACNTGSGEGAGAEAVSGLGRAFFYAGTRALLVSNWPVETSSARKLTTSLFAAQADNPALERAQALRGAMLALIDGSGPKDAQGKVQFSYAHPLFWAPFSLIGDGGGNSTGS
jgi:CHAT domain-containing protein